MYFFIVLYYIYILHIALHFDIIYNYIYLYNYKVHFLYLFVFSTDLKIIPAQKSKCKTT